MRFRCFPEYHILTFHLPKILSPQTHFEPVTGIGVQTVSGYKLVKAVKCHQQGEANVLCEQCASMGFANNKTLSNDNHGDPSKAGRAPVCTYPGGREP